MGRGVSGRQLEPLERKTSKCFSWNPKHPKKEEGKFPIPVPKNLSFTPAATPYRLRTDLDILLRGEKGSESEFT